MLFELIAVIVAGFAAAGLALILGWILRGRLPRWFMPVTAGVAMLAVTIANEYGWYPRTSQSLPDGLSVAMTVEETAFYRPWTYAKPFVSRFLAVDIKSLQTNAALPDQRLADVYAFARWTAPSRVSVAVDCAAGRRAEITEGVTLSEDGALLGAPWRDVGADDEILLALCRES